MLTNTCQLSLQRKKRKNLPFSICTFGILLRNVLIKINLMRHVSAANFFDVLCGVRLNDYTREAAGFPALTLNPTCRLL